MYQIHWIFSSLAVAWGIQDSSKFWLSFEMALDCDISWFSVNLELLSGDWSPGLCNLHNHHSWQGSSLWLPIFLPSDLEKRTSLLSKGKALLRRVSSSEWVCTCLQAVFLSPHQSNNLQLGTTESSLLQHDLEKGKLTFLKSNYIQAKHTIIFFCIYIDRIW